MLIYIQDDEIRLAGMGTPPYVSRARYPGVLMSLILFTFSMYDTIWNEWTEYSEVTEEEMSWL
jgi:hypothetical protein